MRREKEKESSLLFRILRGNASRTRLMYSLEIGREKEQKCDYEIDSPNYLFVNLFNPFLSISCLSLQQLNKIQCSCMIIID